MHGNERPEPAQFPGLLVSISTAGFVSPAVLIADPDQCKCLVLLFLQKTEDLCKPPVSCKGG